MFVFIAAKKAEHSIKLMCRVLGGSRSGFRAWAAREPSARAVADDALSGRIAEIHTRSLKTYGSARVHAELRLEDGVRVGRKRVERLMRRAGLSGQVKRRRGKTTIRVQGVRTAPDLVERDFNPAAQPPVVRRHRAPRGAAGPCGGERPPRPACRSRRVKLGAA